MKRGDRFIPATFHDNQGYVLDDTFHEMFDAVDYLTEQGFSIDEARAYLRALPKGAR